MKLGLFSSAGSYTSCNTTVNKDVTAFTLDPLSDERYEAWTARNRPEISW